MTHLSSNPRCIEKQKQWKLSFNKSPQAMIGFKYDAGRLVMGRSHPSGERTSIDIERSARDLDRKL